VIAESAANLFDFHNRKKESAVGARPAKECIVWVAYGKEDMIEQKNASEAGPPFWLSKPLYKCHTRLSPESIPMIRRACAGCTCFTQHG
jgi:hypothetical protein